MVTDLDEVVIRQIDNLFLLNLPHYDDVRHVSKSSLVDEETIKSFAQRLPKGQAMLVGQATKGYPIVFKIDPATGIDMAGETLFAFEPRKDVS